MVAETAGLVGHLGIDAEDYDVGTDRESLYACFSLVASGQTVASDLGLYSISTRRYAYASEHYSLIAEVVTPIETDLKQLIQSLSSAQGDDSVKYTISEYSLEGIRAMVKMLKEKGAPIDPTLQMIADTGPKELELTAEEAQNLGVVLREKLSELLPSKFSDNGLINIIDDFKEKLVKLGDSFNNSNSGQFGILRD